MPLTTGTRLGRYEMAPIGAGGNARGDKARETQLAREVAVEVSAKRFTNARRADRSRLTKGNQPRCISSFVLAGALSRVRVNSSSTAFHLAERHPRREPAAA